MVYDSNMQVLNNLYSYALFTSRDNSGKKSPQI
jgi:hypothetical protein